MRNPCAASSNTSRRSIGHRVQRLSYFTQPFVWWHPPAKKLESCSVSTIGTSRGIASKSEGQSNHLAIQCKWTMSASSSNGSIPPRANLRVLVNRLTSSPNKLIEQAIGTSAQRADHWLESLGTCQWRATRTKDKSRILFSVKQPLVEPQGGNPSATVHF